MIHPSSDEARVFERLQTTCLIAVLVIDREEDAVPVGEALLAGGVTAMELTLRTPAALGALRRIKKALPDMLAGIGTVLTPDQVTQVVNAGGEFAVAPGTNPRVIEAALNAHLPFAPGICTPSDIEQALEFDRRLLKFFPAQKSGGLAYLRAIAAPYQHLGLRYMPLGGVSLANMGEYLGETIVGGIGGSWLASREVIREGEWEKITAACRKAIAVRDQALSGRQVK